MKCLKLCLLLGIVFLFHKQEGQLCAQHCLNNLLQGNNHIIIASAQKLKHKLSNILWWSVPQLTYSEFNIKAVFLAAFQAHDGTVECVCLALVAALFVVYLVAMIMCSLTIARNCEA